MDLVGGIHGMESRWCLRSFQLKPFCDSMINVGTSYIFLQEKLSYNFYVILIIVELFPKILIILFKNIF